MSSENSPKKTALAKMAGLDDKKTALPREFTESDGTGPAAAPAPAQLNLKCTLDEILVFARTNQASDVHLSVNNPILFRQSGSLQPQTQEKLSAQRLEEMIKSAVAADKLADFQRGGDAEFIHTVPGAGRSRVTLIKQRLGWDFTARLIPAQIRSLAESGLPASCQTLTKWAQGLVLVTGPAGCGKTSTLATLIGMINETRHDHIITIENPIEIVYTPKKCQITQREINKHTLSQANALRAALREDPDILVVSELRDLESIQLAVTAAETGHLVFGTMNTNTATQTISSVINSFPPDEQDIITNMISESLRGVICQQLIPRKDGKGVVPAYEVLIMKTALANMIRTGNINQLNNAMTTSLADGMVLFDTSLENLVKNGTIDVKEALSRAINPAAVEKELSLLIRQEHLAKNVTAHAAVNNPLENPHGQQN